MKKYLKIMYYIVDKYMIIMYNNSVRKEGKKVIKKIKKAIQVVELLEQLIIRIISLVGWILILIYVLRD